MAKHRAQRAGRSWRAPFVVAGCVALVATLLGGLGVASASRVILAGKDPVGTGRAPVVVCDASTALAYDYRYDAAQRTTLVSAVTVTGIAASCAGSTVSVVMSNGATVLSSSSGVVPVGGGSVVLTLPLAQQFDPELVSARLVLL